jgi:D-3-phosphoglycerate dehydrogenase
MRFRVFVSPRILNPFAESVLASSANELDVAIEVVSGARLVEAERVRALEPAHAFFGIPTREELRTGPNLEVVAVPGSGTDGLDVADATARGIAVVNAAGAQQSAVAEHALGLMLSLAKRIAVSDRWFHAEQRFPGRSRHSGPVGTASGLPTELDGKTIGIVGYGHVGRELAAKCRLAFHMRVLAYDPYADPGAARQSGVELVAELATALGAADFVSLHVPLDASTRHLLGEAELRAMKPTAYLIDLSRGGVVDAQALLRALDEGWIAGAGLDVFDPEPLPDGHRLFALENIVLTPHVAGWTAEALPRLARVAVEEMLAVLRGVRPERLVNPEVWPVLLARRGRA